MCIVKQSLNINASRISAFIIFKHLWLKNKSYWKVFIVSFQQTELNEN